MNNIKLYLKYFFYYIIFVFVSVPFFLIMISIMYWVPIPIMFCVVSLHSKGCFKLFNMKHIYHFDKLQKTDGMLVVANHISWIDILTIGEIYKVIFIAKSELQHWPILGRVIVKYGNIFVKKSRNELRTINKKIEDRLKEGASVAVFPEGITTDGDTVIPFKSAIFQVAIDTQCPILPIVIVYKNKAGKNIAPIITYNNKNLWQSAKDTIRMCPIEIHIYQLPLIHPKDFKDRTELCEYVHNEIQKMYLKAISNE